jgi:hypothetical protein
VLKDAPRDELVNAARRVVVDKPSGSQASLSN